MEDNSLDILDLIDKEYGFIKLTLTGGKIMYGKKLSVVYEKDEESRRSKKQISIIPYPGYGKEYVDYVAEDIVSFSSIAEEEIPQINFNPIPLTQKYSAIKSRIVHSNEEFIKIHNKTPLDPLSFVPMVFRDKFAENGMDHFAIRLVSFLYMVSFNCVTLEAITLIKGFIEIFESGSYENLFEADDLKLIKEDIEAVKNFFVMQKRFPNSNGFFHKYLNEEVIVKRDDDYKNDKIEGRLVEIIPYDETEDLVETLVVETEGSRIQIPVNMLMQFFSKKELADENTEYYYVIFRYGKTERSQNHIYMSYDTSIQPGDKVLVWQGWDYVGNVVHAGFYKKNNAPFPVEKTWLIEEKVYPWIDFNKYDDSRYYIRRDNSYKQEIAETENRKRFIAKAEFPYQFLSDESEREDFHLYGDRTNQMNVFYDTLACCAEMAKEKNYRERIFDKYICLSLIYKHGDFDRFLLAPEIEKPYIDRDIELIDNFLQETLGEFTPPVITKEDCEKVKELLTKFQRPDLITQLDFPPEFEQ